MGKTAKSSIDAIRDKLHKAAADSKLTQQEIGERMDFEPSGHRQAVSRLLNPEVNYDPRLSTLLAFSAAIKRPLKELL